MKKDLPACEPLPAEGFVRLNRIVLPHGCVPVSKSKWWKGVGDGTYPKPVKLGPNTTAWRVEDIRALIDQLSHQEAAA